VFCLRQINPCVGTLLLISLRLEGETMSDPLAPLVWTEGRYYDCTACHGESRRVGTDCPECGGTGWHPPHGIDPDVDCDDCGRPLWLHGRGPQWFEDIANGIVRCRFCLLKALKKRQPGTSPLLQLNYNSRREQKIDLAAFVDKGDGGSDS